MVNPMSDKYSLGATQAEKNVGKSFFVLGLECSAPRRLTRVEESVSSQQRRQDQKSETLKSEIYMDVYDISSRSERRKKRRASEDSPEHENHAKIFGTF